MACLLFDGSFWCNLDIAQRRLTQIYGEEIEELGLNVIEAYTLRALNEQGAQRASDLANSVGRASTSFTPILDGLERKSLIERQMNPRDRRSIYLSLTPEGDRLSKQATHLLQATDKAIQEAVGEGDLNCFLEIVLQFQRVYA